MSALTANKTQVLLSPGEVAEVVVTGVSDDVVKRLVMLADADGVSLEELVRKHLIQLAQSSPNQVVVDRLKAKAGSSAPSVEEIVEAVRDSRRY